MARSQETFNKKERAKKKQKKKQEKEMKRQERKENSSKGLSFEDQIAYVDEFGRIVDEPVDLTKRKEVNAETISLSNKRSEGSMEDPLHEGKLIFFKEDKGFGFIKDIHNDEKYFVHINNFIDDIKENDKCHFEIERGPRGLNAIKVKLGLKPVKEVEPELEDLVEGEEKKAEDTRSEEKKEGE